MTEDRGPRAKRWCFTKNSYTSVDPPEGLLEKTEYLLFGEEEAPETGEPHLQGYAVFNGRVRLSQIKSILDATEWAGAHWEKARGTTADNYKYCTKGSLYHEYGTKPDSDKDGSELSQERCDWAEVYRLAEAGGVPAVAAVYPKAAVCQFQQVRAIHEARQAGLKKKPRPLSHVCGVWVWGLRGSGKSTFAEELWESKYKRIPADHCWSAYDGEEVILYDDVDYETVEIKHFTQELKHVADKWTFTKRDLYKKQEELRPKVCMVTSQYRIEDLWRKDREAREALQRRFWSIEVLANPRTYRVIGPCLDDEIQLVTIFYTQEDAMEFIREKMELCVESAKKTHVE